MLEAYVCFFKQYIYVDSQAELNNGMTFANLASRQLVCVSLDANRI